MNAKICIHHYLHPKHYDQSSSSSSSSSSPSKCYCLLITYIDDGKECEIAIQYKTESEMLIWYNAVSDKILMSKSKREIGII